MYDIMKSSQDKMIEICLYIALTVTFFKVASLKESPADCGESSVMLIFLA